MDVPALIPAGRQVIESYGNAGFRVSGAAYAGSILVFADKTLPWPIAGMDDLSVERLAPVVARGDVEILLLGCGRRMAPVPQDLRKALRAAGVVLDALDTGAARRAYH